MARALGFLIRYFSNYYTLHRSDFVLLHHKPDKSRQPPEKSNDFK